MTIIRTMTMEKTMMKMMTMMKTLEVGRWCRCRLGCRGRPVAYRQANSIEAGR